MAVPKKRIAVIIRGRQSEGLRMAVGLTVLGDMVDVYIMEVIVEKNPQFDTTLEALRQMGGKAYTDNRRNPFEFVTTESVAVRLLDYDVIVPY